jgi:hypothetical protein
MDCIRPLHRLVYFLWLLGMLIAGCTQKPDPAAQVGEIAISQSDIAFRQQVAEVRSGEALPAHIALLQLIQEALALEVGKRFDVLITEEMLAEEAERVATESRDPETLARIQEVFGQDEQAYRRLMLTPILVNQLLTARFSLGYDIQAEPLGRAQEALASAMAGEADLVTLAEEYGGEYRRLLLQDGQLQRADGVATAAGGPGGDELPAELTEAGEELPDYDKLFVEQVLAGLQAGQMHPKVVEDRQSFMIVRLTSRDGEDAELESVIFPKLAFEPWLQAQSQGVELAVFDRDLLEALLAEVELPNITDRLR